MTSRNGMTYRNGKIIEKDDTMPGYIPYSF
jgi:hypothetical protein